jgi:predicted transcriptional regulator YdeE
LPAILVLAVAAFVGAAQKRGPAAAGTEPPASAPEEEPKMKVSVVKKEAFRVVGVELHNAGKKAYLIMYAWIALSPKLHLVKNQLRPHVLYGIWYKSPDADDHSYLVGVEVSDFKDVPAGMVAYTVPASHFAVFTHKGNVGGISNTYGKITQWLKETGAEQREAATFEVYDTTQVVSDEYEFTIYEPINADPGS